MRLAFILVTILSLSFTQVIAQNLNEGGEPNNASHKKNNTNFLKNEFMSYNKKQREQLQLVLSNLGLYKASGSET